MLKTISLCALTLALCVATVTDAQARRGGHRTHHSTVTTHPASPVSPTGMVLWHLIMPDGTSGRACTQQEVKDNKCRRTDATPQQ